MSLKFKKNKQEVLNDIQNRANNVAYNQLYGALSNLLKLDSNSYGGPSIKLDSQQMTFAIQNAIAAAVVEGFRSMLENEYTDEDFEKDLTIT